MKVVKHEFKLYVYNNDKVIKSYNVAVGRNLGQKQRAGDNRTPEGNFTVQQIQRSDYWSHDFRDGKGVIEKAYGPWFIRLKTGWKGIGIHGTHAPSSIGKNDTEGCIRLRNEELVELKNNHIKIGMPVVIVK
ncbi:MAG: L,D-transpeptidase [Synergistaceae bacterium]|nr:L,D-transpeptidase [Synergistaceae bacterium]